MPNIYQKYKLIVVITISINLITSKSKNKYIGNDIVHNATLLKANLTHKNPK